MAKFSQNFMNVLAQAPERQRQQQGVSGMMSQQAAPMSTMQKGLSQAFGMDTRTYGQQAADREREAAKEIDAIQAPVGSPEYTRQALAIQARTAQTTAEKIAVAQQMAIFNQQQQAAEEAKNAKVRQADSDRALYQDLLPVNEALANQVLRGSSEARKKAFEVLGREAKDTSGEWKSMGGSSNAYFNNRTGEVRYAKAGQDPKNAPLSAEQQDALIQLGNTLASGSTDVVSGITSGVRSGALRTIEDVKKAIPASAKAEDTELSASLETAIINNSEKHMKAVGSVERIDAVLTNIAENPDLMETTGGYIDTLKAFGKDVLGLRDTLSFVKTAATKEINTEIINGLPPGVASDTDIEIFSRGFPPESAGISEIMDYLNAAKRINQVASQGAALFDGFMQSNLAKGVKTSTGFVAYQAQYKKASELLDRQLRAIKDNGGTVQDMSDEVSRMSSAFGGVLPQHVLDKYR